MLMLLGISLYSQCILKTLLGGIENVLITWGQHWNYHEETLVVPSILTLFVNYPIEWDCTQYTYYNSKIARETLKNIATGLNTIVI